LRVHRTNGIQGVQQVSVYALMRRLYRLLCVGVASHAPSACASAPPGRLADGRAGGCVVGFIVVAFFCFTVDCLA
jgi:hypothetical protein